MEKNEKKNSKVCETEKDIHSHLVNPVTSGLFFKKTRLEDDSGYQTSYTPDSLEDSEIFGENLSPSINNDNIGFTGQFKKVSSKVQTITNRSTPLTPNKNDRDTPQKRRGTKRLFQGASEGTDIGFASIQTPTSVISGGLHRLKVNDSNKINSGYSPGNLGCIEDIWYEDSQKSFPTTPIKKTCWSNNCKVNSYLHHLIRDPASEIHSIYCDQKALQPVLKTHPKNCAWIKKYPYEPNQKYDIIKMLYNDGNYLPPLELIFNHLSCEEIYQVTLVSPVWQNAWEDVNTKLKNSDYRNYKKSLRQNQENNIDLSNGLNNCYPINHLSINLITCPVSPPGTPRTIRFKTYTKAASMDSRKQLSCVRCQYPAKITEETSGEELVECTSSTCAYRFCRLCKCMPHPGKTCITYSLEGPSPSKRKKNTCAIGSKKSRMYLKRL